MFEILTHIDRSGTNDATSPDTAVALELIAQYSSSPLSTRNFMALTIQELLTQLNFEFRMTASEETSQVVCYFDDRPIALKTTNKNPWVEANITKLPEEEQQLSRDNSTLMQVYLTLLEPLQRQYTNAIRLSVQRHDALPIIAEQAWHVQKRLNTAPVEPSVSSGKLDKAVKSVHAHQEKITQNVISPFDVPHSPRTPEEVRHAQPLDEQTIKVLATVKAVGDWVSREYLKNVTLDATLPLIDDPWKQARIQNSTYWNSFEHIFDDGLEGQYEIISNLLTYHCVINHIKLSSLQDILQILNDPGFVNSLHALLGASNGENVRLLRYGLAPADMLTNSEIPEISQAGKAYLKSGIRQHNGTVGNQDSPWYKTKISRQLQRRCPAAVRTASLRPIISTIPQPGESTITYIEHLKKLEVEQPGVFTLEEDGDGSYRLSMVQDPINLLTSVLTAALENYPQE